MAGGSRSNSVNSNGQADFGFMPTNYTRQNTSPRPHEFTGGGGVAAGGGGGHNLGHNATLGDPQGSLHRTRFGHPADDLPLLEELGIVPSHIRSKATAVLHPLRKVSTDTSEGTDLAGPVVFAVILALLLSLQGKVQFSAIYGLSLFGILGFKALLGLMSEEPVCSLLIISTLGYCLIPILLLACVQTILFWIVGVTSAILPLAFVVITWSGWCGAQMFAAAFHMSQQKFLILYPLLIFYAVFAALTIF
eukprot:GFYU01064650.1.p1 GENE.GFYU01064650.1~~GFYU01064650.1.p1  ORF type:complete len:249 (+),score=6.92 GFYU01064650.1:63-809(+)